MRDRYSYKKKETSISLEENIYCKLVIFDVLLYFSNPVCVSCHHFLQFKRIGNAFLLLCLCCGDIILDQHRVAQTFLSTGPHVVNTHVPALFVNLTYNTGTSFAYYIVYVYTSFNFGSRNMSDCKRMNILRGTLTFFSFLYF